MLNKIIHLFFSIFIFASLTGCINQRAINREINKIPQNNLFFVEKNLAQQKLITTHASKELRADYLEKFYFPWTAPFAWQSKDVIKNDIIKIINDFKSHPGWDANQNLHTATWANNIDHNISLASYPNIQQRAITVRTTALRMLPSESPSFTDWYAAGQGYPFDNLETMYLSANTPLYILHTTRDRQWDLVITPYKSYGWIKSLDVASVDTKFINEWQKHRYIVALQDGKSILDFHKHYRANTAIGVIFPVIKTTNHFYEVLIAISNMNGKAQLVLAKLPKNAAAIWPLKITQQNIAELANHFLGNPYGWGDLYNYRDCSETMRSLFAPFSIWLPKNSADQTKMGKFISLTDLDNWQKQKLIIKLGKPFRTFLWMPGHIMLYIGEKNGKAYAFHQPWGLRTANYFGGASGRVVIGRTVITTLDIGENYVDTEKVYLDLIEGFTVLGF